MSDFALSRVISGQVMHRRRQPVENRFVYPVFYMLINIDELETFEGSWLFGINCWRPLAFNFADHGDGQDPRIWVKEQLTRYGIMNCTGSIWVQTFPRVFGYVFNPVSFWFCERADSSIGAIIAEVNNTFGERHCYVLTPDKESGRFNGIWANKKLYVSPFYPQRGGYRFYFNTDFDAPKARIEYYQDGQPQLNTAIWGKSKPISTISLLSAILRQPLLTFGIIVRIHWQALRLWFKGVSLYDRQSSTVKET